MAKLHTVVMLMLGVAVLSAVAAASAVAPRGNLEVAQLSVSGLHAKFKSGNAHVHAITTNSSIRVHSVEPAPVGSAAFVVGSERKIVHGKATGTHTAAVTQLLDKVFLSLHSKNERTVMLEVPEEAASYDPQYIDDMYLESPRIVSGVEAALRTYEATMEEIFTRHTDSLTAFVDMSWQAGQDHGVTGKAFPHTLALHLLALETSKSLDDWVPPPPVEHASTSRRVLQAPSNCEQKGFFECGGVFTLPDEQTIGGVTYCCRGAPVAYNSDSNYAGVGGSGVSGQCSPNSYPDPGTCSGMCGPTCHCFSSICGDCCPYQVCSDHDRCCDQTGYGRQACWNVLLDFFAGGNRFSCYSQYPGCNVVFGGH